MGATRFVVVNGDFVKELAFELDFFVNTRNVAEAFPLMEYTRWVLQHFILLLCTNGMLMLWTPACSTSMAVSLTSPPDEPFPGFNAISLLGHGTVFGGSRSANKEECLQIHQLAVHKSMKP
jgi:hypothetical protein